MEAAEQQVYRLHPSDLRQGDFARQVYVAYVPESTPKEALFEREYWGMVQGKLRIGDKIEVQEEGGAYYGELLVRNTNPFTVVDLYFKDFEPLDSVEPESNFEVKFAGPKKYRVIRKSDKMVMKEGIQTKEEAYREAADQEKAHRR